MTKPLVLSRAGIWDYRGCVERGAGGGRQTQRSASQSQG